MKRIATAAVGVPLALAAVFRLPGLWFFLVVLILIELGVAEYARLVERSAPACPSRLLLVLVPIGAVVLSPGLRTAAFREPAIGMVTIVALAVSVGIGSMVLLLRVPPEQGLISLGALTFGLAYFALPVASLHYLQQLDPYLVVLLFAVVWLGDTAAFYCGKRWGRHKMAPRVSPNKTWEGAVAGIAAAVLAGVLWCYWRSGESSPSVIWLVAITAVAGQLGDLVESLIKRGAGVKDSGDLLPGHGGVMDRLDALFFAAPIMMLGANLWLEGGPTP